MQVCEGGLFKVTATVCYPVGPSGGTSAPVCVCVWGNTFSYCCLCRCKMVNLLAGLAAYIYIGGMHFMVIFDHTLLL